MKKVLSFVLVLSLVLGSFSMAFAATPAKTGLSDISGNANEQAINVAYNLKIVTGNPDGTYLPEKAVNRAEFAAMITRALAIPESALTANTSKFKDTTGYSWAVPYLAFCESKGIMLGDGNGNAMPGRTITNNEAVTMALRAVGYTSNSAKLVGVWPSNYVTLAQAEGLYDDVAKNATGVDKANAAQIIYNLLTVGLVQVNSDGQTTPLNKTLLTANHDASVRTEVVKYEDDSMINVIPYVGKVAEVYRDGKTTNDPIIAIGEIKTVALTGNFTKNYTDLDLSKDVSDLTTTNSGLVFEADDVEYTFTKDAMDKGLRDAWDGISYDSFLNGDTKAITAAWDDNTDFTINAKVQGKKIVAWASTESWVITQQDQVDKADLEDITADQELLGYGFTTDKNDKIVEDSYELVGVASLDKIAADNIVYVYTEGNDTKKDIRRVTVGTETVEGIVKSEDDGDFTINGKVYNNADNAKKKLDTKNVGDTVKIYLDGYGDIYKFDLVKGSGSASDYAVVTKTNTTSGYDKIVKMITADGSEKQYVVTKDIDSTLFANLNTTGYLKVGQIIAYGLNKDGKIDDMLAATTGTTETSITLADGAYLSSAKTLVNGSDSLVIDSNVTVFTYEGTTTSGATDWDVAKIADVEKGKDHKIDVANGAVAYLDEDGHVVALLIPEDLAGTNDDTYAVINKQVSTTDDDNESVWQIVGLANGDKMDKITSSRANNRTPDSNFGSEIQLYKVTLDSNGVITKLDLVSSQGAIDSSASFARATGYEVKSADDGYVVITGGALDGKALPISDKAAKYEVTFKTNGNIDEYKTFTGSIKEGYKVWLFETDDDEDGYDVVIIDRAK